MSIHVALRHRTTYRYDRPVHLGPQVIRLKPAPHCRTRILTHSLRVTPRTHFLNWQQDPQSNYLARLVFPEPTREFRVDVEVIAEMAVLNPFDFFLEPGAEHFPFRYPAVLTHELEPFHRRLPVTHLFGEYLRGIRHDLLGRHAHLTHATPLVQTETAAAADGFLPGPEAAAVEPDTDPRPRTIDFLVAINQQLQQDIDYRIRMEPGVQTPEETLESGSGSCRDSAWLLVQLLRHLGLAARFVSGYLIQLKPDLKSLDGPSGAEEDFVDLHAWCEVYLPGAGWIGLDPTSGLLAGEGHIPLAATPDPSNAAPISGAHSKAEVRFEHHMTVERIHETPRVTKPYSAEQWESILRLGDAIDARLRQQDARLTMGGEPTFVSIDDPDGDEWNTAAQGPTKRRLSDQLLRRLKARFAPGGLLFHGQGKWYPGEPLPRYAFACYWRKDGGTIWRDEQWCAPLDSPRDLTEHDARRFAETLATRLGVTSRHLQPGYEDAFYYLWKERTLPVNVDPFESQLSDADERARLARIFSRGLDAVIGYALPLKHNGSGWESGPWFLRSERLYLIPGDSPMGYRLPLDSLPWVLERDFPWLHSADPLQQWPPLAAAPETLTSTDATRTEALRPVSQEAESTPAITHQSPGETSAFATAPSLGESASWITRTALCTEIRDGCLHVFLPPLRDTETFLELAAAIEDTAATLDLPVLLEGSPPPFDPRLDVIKVTPDPGVIEVNMHPAHRWRDLVHQTTTLYQEARLTRLGTEKFLLDGRHSGTGGGNHIV
ncbi:MAG: transglutaminase family protein, partial [Verrucomicrobiales bacterium]|nr:transglutaminase family protein [Verrucomicrobiales bacterium]